MLRQLGELTMGDLDRKGLLAAVPGAEVLWVRLRNRVDAEVMDAAPQLKIIVSHSTGLNHIDLEAAALRGIRVISLRGEADFLKEIRATAELTLALILASVRHLPGAVAH